MLVGIAEIELRLMEVNSLKDKRSLVKSLVERLGNRFNASVAEVDFMDIWGRSVIGIAVVSNDSSHASKMLDSIINFIENFHPCVEVVHIDREII